MNCPGPYLAGLNGRHQEARRNMRQAGEAHTERRLERERQATEHAQRHAEQKALQEAEQLVAQRDAQVESLRHELDAARRRIAELEARWSAGLSLSSETEHYAPVKKIIACVARAHDVLIADLLGRRRFKPLEMARHHLAARLKVMRPDLSIAEIGRRMNGRDHATVLNSVNRWPFFVPECQREIAAVDKMLGAMVEKSAEIQPTE